MTIPLVSKPFERPDVSDGQVTKQFERPYVSNERMARAVRTKWCFQRMGDQVVRTGRRFNERVTKPFERVYISNERVTKSFKRADGLNGRWLSRSNGWQTACKRKDVSVRFPVEGHGP